MLLPATKLNFGVSLLVHGPDLHTQIVLIRPPDSAQEEP